MNESLPKNVKFIPYNVLKKGKILNIDWIRWGEAILFSGLMGISVWSTGLTVKIRLIIVIVLGTSIIAFFLHGIKNRSVIQVIADLIKDRRCRTKCSLAGPDKKDKKRKNDQFGSQSMFQRIISMISYYAQAFDNKYGA